MAQENWLHSSLVLPDLDAKNASQLLHAVALAVSHHTGTEPDVLESAFDSSVYDIRFSLGNGVAIPHIEVEGLADTIVCLAVLRSPLSLATVDGQPLDIVFFVFSRPDKKQHLFRVAHLARLTMNTTFLHGLRRAKTSEEIVELVRIIEAEHALSAQSPSAPPQSQVLVVIAIGGEKIVDALLVDLFDQGYIHADILEAQSLQEAITREVPLFTGFRDIFGDPGGRRVVLLETVASKVESIVTSVQRSCQQYPSSDARVSVLPLQTHWFSNHSNNDTSGKR